ncbi:MAG: hypothetical protein ACRD2W_23985 [Acidimicrobiales bacterium]
MDDDLEGLIMQQQDELQDDVEAVEAYGRAHPDVYGGVRFNNDDLPGPVRLIVSFADDLDRHVAELRSVVAHPMRVDVRSCMSSRDAAVAMADRITKRLLQPMPNIRSLAVLHSVWSGTTVLVDGADLDFVRQVLHDEPVVTVDEGGYRHLTDLT